MNAVYCSLPVVADDVTGRKEIDVFLSTLLQRTEKGIQCLILVLYLLGNPGVKRRVGKERVFHEKDRRIGMLAADDGIEFVSTLLHLLHSGIGYEVKDKHGSIYASYDISNLQIEQGIATKAQIDTLAIEPTFQNIGMCHTRTRSTTTLQDTGTIEHHRFLALRQVHCRLSNLGKRIHSDRK